MKIIWGDAGTWGKRVFWRFNGDGKAPTYVDKRAYGLQFGGCMGVFCGIIMTTTEYSKTEEERIFEGKNGKKESKEN